MKYDVQNIVNEVLEGSREWTERLPELLKDREFRQKYVRLMIDESLISDAVAVEADQRKLDVKPSRKPIAFTVIAALAAALVFAFIIFNKPQKDLTAQIVTGNENYAQGAWLKTGTPLKISNADTVTLEFKDKSTVTLNGPFEGRLNTNGMKLVSGSLEASINKQKDNKFEVETPHGKINVVGTAFTVSSLSSSTELEVKEGKVKIFNKSKTLTVEPDEFVVAADSVPFEVFKKDSQNLPDSVVNARILHSMNKPVSAGTKFIYPDADISTRGGGFSHKKYGHYRSLTASTSSANTQSTRHIYIRFDLSRYNSPVSSAKLKLFTTDSLSGKCGVKLISDDSWDEKLVDFNNTPEEKPETLLTFEAKKMQYIELDLTDIINREIKNDKQISLYIYAEEGSRATFASKEHEVVSQKPLLIIEP